MSYFTADTFKFLRDLSRHNEREWFHAQKARYETAVRGPFLRLITDLAEPLAQISPQFRADPRPVGGSLFRIQRDTRFANDKAPYKTWAGARFFHARHKQVEAPLFYLQIAPGNCFVAAGLWRPEPETQRRIRDFLVDNPAAWKRAVHTPAFRKRFTMDGESLVRPPRGFDPAHELIDDIKRKDFVVSRAFDDAMALDPRLRHGVAQEFKRMAPMVDYLCAALDLEF
jgi:uncharacterized protein (TIGR02453 family)